jgi:fido (protein-threonine AMPylation protein)
MGSSVIYAQPSSIEPRLYALFEFANAQKREQHLHPSMPRWMFMLRLGALFYSEFLLIHPFSDGNGRTARILFSAFIRDDIPFPVSLYSHGGRDEYLAALVQRNDHTAPIAFASYVVNACNRTAGIINWLAVE